MLPKNLLRSSQPSSPAIQPTETTQPARSGKVTPSIISSDLTIRGELLSTGDLQIEGKVIGKIEVGQLVVAESGSVEGEIIAKAVRISGQVNGSIQAESVTLTATARIEGDILHEVLSIEAGAQLEGQCRRKGSRDKKLLAAPTVVQID